MEIFYGLCGLAALVIGAVIFLMIKDEKASDETVQKLSTDTLANPFAADAPAQVDPVEPSGKKPAKKSLVGGLMKKLKPPALKKKGKKSNAPAMDPFAAAPAATAMAAMPEKSETPKKASLLSKLKLGKKKTSTKAAEPGSPKESKSLIGKLLKKFKRGKGKEDILDIPKPTAFPVLDKEPDQTSSIPLVQAAADPDEGSANLRTNPADRPADEPVEPLISFADEKKVEDEIEAQTQLSELKEKYEKLEQMFREKSEELDKTDHSLQNEVSNRKEFNKVKDILEKELKDVKDRTKEMQNELASANSDDDEHKQRIFQLEEKAINLEKVVSEKEDEIEKLVVDAEAKENASTDTPPDDTKAEAPPVEEASEPVPEPEPEANAEPIPEPVPEPEVEKVPEPEANAEPIPEPVPEPEVEKVPEPEVTAEPIPEPEPTPEKPEPEKPTPEPTPEPEPVVEEPTPEPEKTPDPTPEPEPAAKPEPPSEEPKAETATPAPTEEVGGVKVEPLTPEQVKEVYDPSDIEKELGIGEIAKGDAIKEASEPKPAAVEKPSDEEPAAVEPESGPEAEITRPSEITEEELEEPDKESDFLALQPDIANGDEPQTDAPTADENKEQTPEEDPEKKE